MNIPYIESKLWRGGKRDFYIVKLVHDPEFPNVPWSAVGIERGNVVGYYRLDLSQTIYSPGDLHLLSSLEAAIYDSRTSSNTVS